MEAFDWASFDGLGQTAALFSMYLPDIIEQHPEIRILSADMSYIAKLERFKALYPDHFINVGIAEQNLIGISAGLSAEGFQCVALAQASFITMRCFEQVRQFMSYMQYPVILVGLAGGFQLQFMGNTHFALEDISLMRSIPGIVIYSPADAVEAVKAFQSALTEKKPAYIRLTGAGAPDKVYQEDFKYDYRRAHCLRQGKEISLLATGSMVSVALRTADLIEEQIDASVKVLDMHVLSPLDLDAVVGCRTSRIVVSLEEHYVTGGLGSAIADATAQEKDYPPLLKLGIRNRYSEVGDYPYLLAQHRLSPESIAEDIIHFYRNYL